MGVLDGLTATPFAPKIENDQLPWIQTDCAARAQRVASVAGSTQPLASVSLSSLESAVAMSVSDDFASAVLSSESSSLAG